MTTRLVVPDKARALSDLAGEWKARLPEIRAGRLVLKGNMHRAWLSDEELCASSGRECRTSAVAAVLDANGISASYGGNGYVYSPHVIGFTAGFRADSVADTDEYLIFTTLGIRIPADLDQAAPLMLAAARDAVAACCKVTRPRFPGDYHHRTWETGTPCPPCRDWLAAETRRADAKRRAVERDPGA